MPPKRAYPHASHNSPTTHTCRPDSLDSDLPHINMGAVGGALLAVMPLALWCAVLASQQQRGFVTREMQNADMSPASCGEDTVAIPSSAPRSPNCASGTLPRVGEAVRRTSSTSTERCQWTACTSQHALGHAAPTRAKVCVPDEQRLDSDL